MSKKYEDHTFWIDLVPRPQERLRFHIRGRGKYHKITPYIPEKTKEFQNSVREMVREHMSIENIPEYPKDLPLFLKVLFVLPRGKTVKREHPIVRPDLSNFLKCIEDGLQRSAKDDEPALMEDDSSICYIECSKIYVNEEYPDAGILVEIGEHLDG